MKSYIEYSTGQGDFKVTGSCHLKSSWWDMGISDQNFCINDSDWLVFRFIVYFIIVPI